MDSRIARLDRIAPRRARARAALWVTELHGPDRNPELEARVRRWIAADPAHARAFELATEAWQRSGDLPASLPLSPARERNGGTPGAARWRFARLGRAWRHGSSTGGGGPVRARLAIAAMIAVCALAAGSIYALRDPTLSTGPREQRTVELADGTEVSLNANTRLTVEFGASERRVRLDDGEALFNVAKNQPRPFTVVVGDRKVVATGTSFLVRVRDAEDSEFDVTLVEGHVLIEPLAPPPPSGVRTPKPRVEALNPGQRLRFSRSTHGRARTTSPDTIDAPSIDRVTAWRRGQLIFDDTSLAEAAAEFDRYDTDRIVIESASAGRLRVGGVFRIGDVESFAQAMASAHHLRVLHRGSTLVLADPTASD
jgi:transmembrane sensor